MILKKIFKNKKKYLINNNRHNEMLKLSERINDLKYYFQNRNIREKSLMVLIMQLFFLRY